MDVYLFFVLCCLNARALAHQTYWIALEQCNNRDWHVNSSRAPETAYEVTLQSLVTLIASMIRICSHYYITQWQLTLT